MPGDVFVTQYCRQVAGYLVWRIDEAASRNQHGRSQRTSNTDYRQKLGNVWSQAERNRSIGVQFTCK